MVDVLPSGLSGFSSLNATGAWQKTFDLTKMAALFGLYASKGDLTVAAGNTYSLPTIQDGPIACARFGALTVNGTFTAANRCRGMVVLCDSLSVGAAGTVSMTARGAAGGKSWVQQDFLFPTNMQLNGLRTDWRTYLAWLNAQNAFIADPNLYANPVPGFGDVQANYASWPGNGVVIVTAAGCGAGAYGRLNGSLAGVAGTAGGNAPGGGGGGGSYSSSSFAGGGTNACPWGGGSGGGGGYGNAASYFKPAQDYCGKGGMQDGSTIAAGAGNPAGDGSTSGVGGVLVIVCRGNATIVSGGVIQADGCSGVTGNISSGGGSGGGVALLAYGGTLSNAGTIRANGGAGGGPGSYGCSGGAGGAGAANAKSFATMGWS